MIIVPAYTAPDTAPIVNGQIADADDVRNLVESSNGVNARLAQLSNNARRVLTVADNGITLNANQDVDIACNATGGAFEFTLPPLATQYKPIQVSKMDATTSWVKINGNGTDKLNSFSTPTLLPTEDFVYLYVGGHSFTLVPEDIGGTNQGWSIRGLQMPFVGFRAFKTDDTTITSTFQKVNWTDEVFDTHATFATGTGATQSRFNPKIPGRYHAYTQGRFNAGTGTVFWRLSYNDDTTTAGIVSNGVLISDNTDTITPSPIDLVLNGTTDFVAVTTGASVSRSTDGGSSNILFGAHLVSL